MPKAKKNTLKSALTALNLQRQKAEKAAKAANSPYVQKQLKGKGVSKSASTPLKATADKPKRPPPFTLEDHILCIGEGNFSFARSLCSTVLHSGYPVVATTLDTEELSYKKYSDCQENVEALKELGAVVLFGVDGTKLEKYAELKGQRFSKIVFNFPHAGMGIKDQDRNIVSNQLLLSGFFTSASQYLTSRTSGQGGMSRTDEADNTDGEIYVTLKSGKPYDLWDIKILAKKAPCPGRTSDAGLVCKTSFAFDTQLYPGYEHRRTIGFQDGLSKGGNEELLGSEGDSSRSPPRTYVFTLVDKKGKGDIAPGYAMEDDDDIKGKRKTRKGKGDRHVE